MNRIRRWLGKSSHYGGRERLANRVVLAVLMSFIAGCSTAMQLGRPPDTQQLERGLTLRVSSKDDVELSLGIPRGGGRVMLPIDEKPRDLWYYYYEESTGTEDRRIFLFVFFDQDKYDGYFWFSSLPRTSIGGK